MYTIFCTRRNVSWIARHAPRGFVITDMFVTNYLEIIYLVKLTFVLKVWSRYPNLDPKILREKNTTKIPLLSYCSENSAPTIVPTGLKHLRNAIPNTVAFQRYREHRPTPNIQTVRALQT